MGKKPNAPSRIEHLETGKLFLRHVFEHDSGVRSLSYFYDGVSNQPETSSLPDGIGFRNIPEKNEDRTFGVIDKYNRLSKNKSVREILEEEYPTNYKLAQYELDAPDGIVLSDPCYLGGDSLAPNAFMIPEAATWEVTFKGYLNYSQSLSHLALHDSFMEEMDSKTRTNVDTWRIEDWSPAATSIYVVKQGAVFSTMEDTGCGFIGFDSGMVGVFPLVPDNLHDPDVYDKKYLDIATTSLTSETIYSTPTGTYSGTPMGDGGAEIRRLFDEERQCVGYVILLASELADGGDQEERDDWAIEMKRREEDLHARFRLLENKYSGRGLSIDHYVGPDYKISLWGRVDGELFFYGKIPSSNQRILRVGRMDEDYRKNVEENYHLFGIEEFGEPYVPTWDDAFPDRQLFNKLSEEKPMSDGLLEEFETLLNSLEAIPEERQLFGN